MEKSKLEFGAKIPEQIKKAEQSEIMEYSDKLLENPIKPGQPGHDKIFTTGHVSREGNVWKVDINPGDPTVALNEKVKNEFGIDSPLVNDMRADKTSGLSLISGGSFIWLNEGGSRKLVLLRRDKDAPVDAGSLTGPAGRCGELPSQTTIAETNEELIIVRSKSSNGPNHYKLLGFYRDEKEKDEVVANKLRQIESRYNDMIKKGELDDAKLLRLIRGADDVEILNIEEYKEKNNDRSERIITSIDGKEVDLIENGTAFFDEESNTLEIREILDVKIPENDEIVEIFDGENFGRDVICINSIEDLKNEKLVPSLKDYFEKLTRQQNYHI
jgi:hypothetical protein